MKNKKGFAFIILLIFTLIGFMLIFAERADARAGGGHRFSGGSSHRSSSSHRSFSSHRSGSSHSRALTKEEIDAIIEFFKKHKTTFVIFFLLHILSWLAVYRRSGMFQSKEFDCHWVLPLVMLVSVGFCFITPLYLLLEIKFVIDDIKRGKFMSFDDMTFEDMEKEEAERIKLSEAEKTRMVNKIKANDPDFDFEIMKPRIEKAFRQIQESWSNRNLTKAERFLADGTYEQFQIQINQMLATHEQDVMSDVKVNDISLQKVESKAGYDAIYLSINASAINYQINDKTKVIISGNSTTPESFTEIWCFMRRKGAKSLNNHGLIEGFCPNCGAPIEGARVSKCQHCSALLRSGQHDWVLTSITQLSEWRNTSFAAIPGLKALLKEDPSFNISNIEDRLSVIFWRLNEALRTNSADPIRKISTDSFANQLSTSKSVKNFPNTSNTAIGSIEIVGICKEEGNNVLLGQITWSGFNRKTSTQNCQKTIFKLIRAGNAITDANTCFCNSHCPNCGAPETNTGNNVCEYCQTAMNDHKKEWILENVFAYDTNEAGLLLNKAQQLEAQTPADAAISENIVPENIVPEENDSEPQKQEFSYDLNALDYISGTDLLRLTIAMMLADGIIDNRELDIIEKICEMKEISEDKLQAYITELKSKSDPVQFALDTTAIRLDENLLMLLIFIATADGEIADEEAAMLEKLATKMGVPRSILNQTINAVLENQK